VLYIIYYKNVIFLIKLVALAAGDRVRMKLRLAGTMNRWNVEHRTSNVEHRILMTLRFIDFKTSEPQNTEPQNFEELNRCALCFFLKSTEYIIRCWTFNVRPARNALKLVRGK
jgi:hypothetical protein